MIAARSGRDSVALIALVGAIALVTAARGGVMPMRAGSATDAHHIAGVVTPVVTAAVGRTSAAFNAAAFEPNMGQADPGIRFVTHIGGATLAIAAASVALGAPGTQSPVAMQFADADANATLTGGARLPGVVSYILGADPSRWHTDIPTYADVTARGVYPGIDIRYHGSGDQLEYDFIVGPGADAGAIVMKFGLHTRTTIERNGDLVITAGTTVVTEQKPLAWQTIAGHRIAVRAAFTRARSGAIALSIGGYNHAFALVIDPTIAYATYLGGRGDDRALAVAVDASGDAYVTGTTASASFPTTAGAFDTACGTKRSCTANTDVFVSKLNASGTALLYSTFLGGSGMDQAADIAVDATGDAYVTGQTESTDFPTTAGAFSRHCGTDGACNPDSLGPASDAFLTVLSASGSALRYSTYLGGSGRDVGFAVSIGPHGAAYVAGRTASRDFPTTSGAFDVTCGTDGMCNGSSKAFLAVLSPAGTGLRDLQYATYLGGSGDEALDLAETFGHALDVAVDAAGVAYVTGDTSSPDFPVTSGAFQTSLHGTDSNAFVAKLDPSRGGDGSGIPSVLNPALVYSTYLGGGSPAVAALGSHSGGLGIALGPGGTVDVAGFTRATDFPVTSGAVQSSMGGCSEHDGCDGFFAVVTPDGAGASDLMYSTYLGGSAVDRATDVGIDTAGRPVITGMTVSTNFPIHSATQPV